MWLIGKVLNQKLTGSISIESFYFFFFIWYSRFDFYFLLAGFKNMFRVRCRFFCFARMIDHRKCSFEAKVCWLATALFAHAWNRPVAELQGVGEEYNRRVMSLATLT